MRLLLTFLFASVVASAQSEFLVERIDWLGEVPATLDIGEYETHSVASVFGVGQALANRGHLEAIGVKLDAGAGEVAYSATTTHMWTPLLQAVYNDVYVAAAGVRYANTNGSSSVLLDARIGNTDIVKEVGPFATFNTHVTIDVGEGTRYMMFDANATHVNHASQLQTTIALPFTGINNQMSYALQAELFSGTTRLLSSGTVVPENNRLRLSGIFSHRVNNRGNFFFSAIGGAQMSAEKVRQFLDDQAFVGGKFSSASPDFVASSNLIGGLRKDSIVVGSGGSAFVGATFPLQDSAHDGLFYVSGSMFTATVSDNVYVGGRLRAGTGFAEGEAQFVALQSDAVMRVSVAPLHAHIRLHQATTWSWNAFRQVAPQNTMLRGYDYRMHAGENIVNVAGDFTFAVSSAVSIGLFADGAVVWNRGEQLTSQRVVASVGPTIGFEDTVFDLPVALQMGAALRTIDKDIQVFVQTQIPTSYLMNVAASTFPFLESTSIQY